MKVAYITNFNWKTKLEQIKTCIPKLKDEG